MNEPGALSASADQVNTFRQICWAATVVDDVDNKDKAAQRELDSVVDR